LETVTAVPGYQQKIAARQAQKVRPLRHPGPNHLPAFEVDFRQLSGILLSVGLQQNRALNKSFFVAVAVFGRPLKNRGTEKASGFESVPGRSVPVFLFLL
jgi:hypothetical protein